VNTLADGLLSSLALLTRASPYLRGMGTAYRRLNALLLRCGAEPIVIAPMRDGTRMRVDLRTNTDIDAYYRGLYDADLLGMLRTLWNRAGCFLDVGANIGYYSVAMSAWLSEQGGSGRVIGFEPFTGNYQRLRENLALNGLEGKGETFNIGLSDKPGQSLLTLREDFSDGAGTGNAAIPINASFDSGFQMASITLARLDDVWSASQGADARIDLMKLDIEGHEDYCLEGARTTLALHRPTLLMEVNRPYYVARGVGLDARFLPLFPDDYAIFRFDGQRWSNTTTLEVCNEIDNVFLVPKERLQSAGYAVFGSRS
jgi:FkbM family methyltransferase